MVGRWSGGGREVVGSRRWSEVVGGWSEVVGGWSGGGRRVVGEWSEGGRRWSERGRKVVGNWLAVVVWRLQPGSKGVVLLELHVFPYLGHAVQFFT